MVGAGHDRLGSVVRLDHRNSRSATLSGRHIPWKQNSQCVIIETSRSAVSRALASSARSSRTAELVAAEAGNAIALADAVDQHLGDLDQGLVTGLMAEGVVDHLKAVEVDEQHRGHVVVAADPVDRRLELAQEAAAVRQVDQDILMRQPVEQLDALLQLRDLGAQPPDFGEQCRPDRSCR